MIALGAYAPEPIMLTGSGVLLWELLEDPITPEVLSELLGELHGMEPSKVRDEIAPVVEELLRLGVLETAP